MELMRSRAKENMPHVVLTLLSIIQALALELLWSNIREADYLYRGGWIAAVYWGQVVATLFGVLVIWLVYSTNVMRFRWVPRISDSVLPFLVGLVQFSLIEMHGPGRYGGWFLCLALIFALMHGIAHLTMRRARQDGDNDAYFRTIGRATRRDLYPVLGIVGIQVGFGLYLVARPTDDAVAAAGVAVVLGLLAIQFRGVVYFWRWTMEGPPTERLGPGDS